jgi:non-lysosomal glucosylceramidase
MPTDRRTFLKIAGVTPAAASAQPPAPREASPIEWPRKFTGENLTEIAFPLGGIGAGSISLGGRGQLRDWEIFNRPDTGNAPAYAYAAVWAQLPGKKPVAKVAEARYLPPYEGPNGLGSNNSPGIPRLDSAVFTGSYPIARIDFRDRRLPVRLSLESFTPFFPLDADASGLPVAVLRYKLRNPNAVAVKTAISFSIDNPMRVLRDAGMARPPRDERTNEIRRSGDLQGLVMTNSALPADHPLYGDFTLATIGPGDVSIWRGWPQGRWWNSPMLFWDEFSAKGKLEGDPDPRSTVGAICVGADLAPGAETAVTFILAWRYPNRTPERCGWHASKGNEKTVIGNHYCTRFPSSWDAAQYLTTNLPALERKTRAFVQAMQTSTLPGAVKDAAMSNLSTLVSQVCFRTAEGEFHGFEGANEKSGCCHGSCTHVWNYETSTAHLFPSLAVSLRNAAFGPMMDANGAIHFRETLPTGTGLFGYAAADGQMGQIMKLYLDWRLSGDTAWLKKLWPAAKKAMQFAWIPNGWDPEQTGVLQGPQHNTYDVEFYGPNPMCGIYYLGALRASEKMALAVGDDAFAAQCHAVFERGSRAIDTELFNGDFYIQKVRGLRKDQIAPNLVSDMGSDDPRNPEYQVGSGCLIDQLVGQYQAEVCGLGPLVDPTHIARTLQSIYRFNYKRDLSEHISVQRIFALNDESAMVICDYGTNPRPKIPFPYYAEVMTGFEYSTASHMIYAGMQAQGLECIANIRRRYDGTRRNPWNEAECGNHYARAMAAWTPVLALSGFLYDAPKQHLTLNPRAAASPFRSFWSTPSGWGTFDLSDTLTIRAEEGELILRSVTLRSRELPLKGAARVAPGQPVKLG